MDWNERVIEDWESKWLDPDYDIANGKYYGEEEPDDEESIFPKLGEQEEPDWRDMEDEEINEYIAVTVRLMKKFLKMGEKANA